jgi:hypothetical protein
MIDKEAVSTEKHAPEVKAPIYRRTFSREEKLRILEKADACERGIWGHWTEVLYEPVIHITSEI